MKNITLLVLMLVLFSCKNEQNKEEIAIINKENIKEKKNLIKKEFN